MRSPFSKRICCSCAVSGAGRDALLILARQKSLLDRKITVYFRMCTTMW
jgi:hypothetical protein